MFDRKRITICIINRLPGAGKSRTELIYDQSHAEGGVFTIKHMAGDFLAVLGRLVFNSLREKKRPSACFGYGISGLWLKPYAKPWFWSWFDPSTPANPASHVFDHKTLGIGAVMVYKQFGVKLFRGSPYAKDFEDIACKPGR